MASKAVRKIKRGTVSNRPSFFVQPSLRSGNDMYMGFALWVVPSALAVG